LGLRIALLDLAVLDALEVDSLAVFVGEDERPLRGLAGLADWRLCGGLSRLLAGGDFRGAAGETLLTPAAGVPARRVFAFGLGRLEACDARVFAEAAQHALQTLVRAGAPSAALGLPDRPAGTEAARILAGLAQPLPMDITLVGDGPALAAISKAGG